MSTDAALVLHLGVDLLDRQLLDRRGTPCGNVDDVELTVAEDGTTYATALLTGPGHLAYRLGRRRLGEWLQFANRALHRDPTTGDDGGPADDRDADRSRVPLELAVEIGPAIRLARDATDIASHDLERWAADHVIGHIPGGRHAPE
jgi:hypothetical protein